MREIEVKILEVDQEALTKRLLGLGARLVFDGEIRGSFFDFNDKRLRSKGCLLRLRETNDGAKLAFKDAGVNTDVKSRDEFELKLDSPEMMRAILSGLGLESTVDTKKHRTSYKLDGASFEFDTYGGIPTYLEIEASSGDEVRKYVELLGFSMKDAKPWSWREVFHHYGKKET